jgi:hypothetical protein
MVVPFANHGHSSVFILDDIMILHLDSMHAIHRQDVIKCFVRAICFFFGLGVKGTPKFLEVLPISWVSKL